MPKKIFSDSEDEEDAVKPQTRRAKQKVVVDSDDEVGDDDQESISPLSSASASPSRSRSPASDGLDKRSAGSSRSNTPSDGLSSSNTPSSQGDSPSDNDNDSDYEDEDDRQPPKKKVKQSPAPKPSAKPKPLSTRRQSTPSPSSKAASTPKKSSAKLMSDEEEDVDIDILSNDDTPASSSSTSKKKQPPISGRFKKGNVPLNKKVSPQKNATVAVASPVPIHNLIHPFKNPTFEFSVHDNKKKQAWKPVKQILTTENYNLLPANFPTYVNIQVSPSLVPPKKYCDITGYVANYTDPKSTLRYSNATIYSQIEKFPDNLKQSYIALRKMLK